VNALDEFGAAFNLKMVEAAMSHKKLNTPSIKGKSMKLAAKKSMLTLAAPVSLFGS
jgi:hypothetical protein